MSVSQVPWWDSGDSVGQSWHTEALKQGSLFVGLSKPWLGRERQSSQERNPDTWATDQQDYLPTLACGPSQVSIGRPVELLLGVFPPHM